MLSFIQAKQKLRQSTTIIAPIVETTLAKALNRFSAENIIAPISSPPENNSAMDGFAIRSQDWQKNLKFPISQIVAAGDIPQPISPKTAIKIFTGSIIPKGADCVIAQEQCEYDAETTLISQQPQVQQNIRLSGEDFTKQQTLVRQGELINSFRLSLLAQASISHLQTYAPLKAAILSTGNELLQAGDTWRPSKIYDSNRPAIFSILHDWGILCNYSISIPDDLNITRKILLEAADKADFIITCGGVSVGDKDFLKQAITEVGELDSWRVKMKPGKPIAWGKVSEIPFFGLPGNPVSAIVTTLMLCRESIMRMQGASWEYLDQQSCVKVTSDFSYRTSQRCDFVRVKLHSKNHYLNQAKLSLYPAQGSHILSSLTQTDGIAYIPENQQIKIGDDIDYYSFSQLLSL